MNKKIVVIPIVAIIGIFAISFVLNTPEEEEDNTVFHVRLADPSLYTDGIFTDTFTIDEGEYSFRFVPNGSSPDTLSITLNGEKIEFAENFKLHGTPHQAGTSEYFTWEYDGQKKVSISETEEISIVINPNGKVMGSVSVYILEN